MNLTLLFIASIAIIAIGLVIFILYSKYSEDEKVEDNVEVINFMPHLTKNQRYRGILLDQIERDGWKAIVFAPRDVNTKKLKLKNEKLEPEVIFAPKENIITIGKSELSGDVDVMFIIPIDSENIPTSLRDTCIGWGLEQGVKKAHMERVKSDIENTKDKEVKELLEKGVRTRTLADDFIAEMIDKQKQVSDINKKEEK